MFGLLRRRTSGLPAPVLEGSRVLLRPPRMEDWPAWSALRAKSRDFLVPWEPAWPRDALGQAAYRRRLRQVVREREAGEAYGFFVLRRDDRELLGGITLSEIRRGVAQAGSVGYWMGAPHARRGYMGEALRALLPFAFETLALHRLEAACLPENEPSRRLLERTGFRQEGLARSYLRIDGRWRDHLLFALIESEWKEGAGRRP